MSRPETALEELAHGAWAAAGAARFKQLVNAAWPRLHPFVRSSLRMRRLPAADSLEDQVQTVFLRALTYRRSYHGVTKQAFLAWIAAICRRSPCFRHVVPGGKNGWIVKLLSLSEVVAKDPGAMADLRDLARRIAVELARLCALDRAVVHLRYYKGWSLRESADLLGRSASAIHKAEERALNELGRRFA